MSYIVKQLNIESWSQDYVIEWLKGISSYSSNYVESFEAHKINGKKLAIMEQSDLRDILKDQQVILKHQLTIFKSIQNLLQLKHDLNKETLHNLIFNTQNRIISILNYINQLQNCSCTANECSRCVKYKRTNILSASTSLALTYRKLISWLVRIPFTRLKPFENFREEINSDMKNFFRLIRKRTSENFLNDLKIILKSMLDCCAKLLEYCDLNCEKENGKIAVAYSCCYLEKIILRRTSPDQPLGLKLTTLSDGIFTIAEIVRESAADECSHLNVEDDIIAVNHQIVVGWNSENIIKLLENAFSSNTVWLVLRKMPKDHLTSIKQQKKLVFIYKNQNISKLKENDENSKSNQVSHQRKRSFSDIFDFSEDFIMEDSSDEDEEDYADFHRNKSNSNLTSDENLIDMSDKKLKSDRKLSIGLFGKNGFNDKNYNKAKTNKITKKTNKNRLIRSMQNLISFDRSRSNSIENGGSTNDVSDPKTKRKKSMEDSSNKSDLFKSLFTNKRWDLVNSSKNSFESLDSPSTPSLIGVKKIDSIKRTNSKTSNNSSSSINECGISRTTRTDEQTNSPSIVKTVSSKPPIDKNKETYKMKTQKPTMQGWLFKKKPVSSSSTNSSSNLLMNNTNMNGSITSNTSTSSSTNSINKSLIRNHLNRTNKWKKYWCVLTKDYITFYKNPDEKVPKDFLLLKDFEMTKEINLKKFVFILFDKSKQTTHEFYTDQNEEFIEWYTALNELLSKLLGSESMISSSFTSLSSSSGYDTTGGVSSSSHHANDSISSNSSSQSQSLPTSTTLNRKNNLQLQLSTIIDDDSLNNSFQNTASKNSQLSSPIVSPTLMANLNQQYTSSRESSPDFSNSNSKVASRDSSPGLNYPCLQDQETSESDAEMYSLTLCPEKQEPYREMKNMNKNQKNFKNSSAGSLTSAVLAASAGISSNTQIKKQMSFSPSTTSSATKFNYDFQENENLRDKSRENQIQHQRCNSLPGSLQACVGSFQNLKAKTSHKNDSPSRIQKLTEIPVNIPVNSNNEYQNQTPIPVQLEYKNKENKKNETNVLVENTNHNKKLQDLLLQFQTNSLLPKLRRKNSNTISKVPVLSSLANSGNQNSESSNSTPTTPNISFNASQIGERSPQSQYSYYVPQPQCSSPLTPPVTTAKGKSTQIKVQVDPNGKSKMNAFNFLTPDSFQQEQPSLTSNNLRNSTLSSNSPSVVYRTELTIMPTTFNKPPINNSKISTTQQAQRLNPESRYLN